jgi:hypothetical protein
MDEVKVEYNYMHFLQFSRKYNYIVINTKFIDSEEEKEMCK